MRVIFLLLWCAGYVVAVPCANNRSFWLQPQFESCNFDSTTVAAWCYPTAAATLLSYKARVGEWSSSLYTDSQYPDTENEANCTAATTWQKNVTFQNEILWADMIYHYTNESLNMGHYMSSNKSTGTTLPNGKKGIEDFVVFANPHVQAIVTDYNSAVNDTDFLLAHRDKVPFLLHLNQNCMHGSVTSANNESTPTRNIEEIGGDNNENVLSLGHTVLVYDVILKSNEIDFAYLVVASNLKEERTLNTRSCDGMKYTFSGPSMCIKAITTIELSAVVTDNDDPLNIGLIAGLAAGGAVLLGGVVYMFIRKSTSSTSYMV
jgi:hypothetical protein